MNHETQCTPSIGLAEIASYPFSVKYHGVYLPSADQTRRHLILPVACIMFCPIGEQPSGSLYALWATTCTVKWRLGINLKVVRIHVRPCHAPFVTLRLLIATLRILPCGPFNYTFSNSNPTPTHSLACTHRHSLSCTRARQQTQPTNIVATSKKENAVHRLPGRGTYVYSVQPWRRAHQQ